MHEFFSLVNIYREPTMYSINMLTTMLHELGAVLSSRPYLTSERDSLQCSQRTLSFCRELVSPIDHAFKIPSIGNSDVGHGIIS